MGSFAEGFVDGVDTLLAWLSVGLKQTVDSYCDLQTADARHVLVAHDGSLMTVLKIEGVTSLIGQTEYEEIHDRVFQSMQSAMGRPGHSIQFFYGYNKDQVHHALGRHLDSVSQSLEKLGLDLDDLVKERQKNLGQYCSHECVYIVLWTNFHVLSGDEQRQAQKNKLKAMKESDYPPVRYTQNIMAAMPELRDTHDSFVRSVHDDFTSAGIVNEVMDVHSACRAMRETVDHNFTDQKWEPVLPGDKIRIKVASRSEGTIADIMWPSLSHQLLPRDAHQIDLRTAQVGDTLYGSIFIDLFPKQIRAFSLLFNRLLPTGIPWRISFMVDSDGMSALKYKRALSSILSFSSSQNKLINDAVQLLDFIEINSDDVVVKLRATVTTWAKQGQQDVLRMRVAQLSRAVQGWGSCDVSDLCGDPFAGVVSSMLGISRHSVATTTVASFSDTLYMMPLYRPASPWDQGSLLLRTPDGKIWPYQPGSSKQTTWIDLIYARPGSGKSVLSNAINLALALSPGHDRLPRISVIDVGPSSSGLISLIADALPSDQRHQVAYHRLAMHENYAINPFDTELGVRFPLPQGRAFLVNFISLLVTPVGSTHAYDGMTDMIGLVIDEAYKQMSDAQQPNVYTTGTEDFIDAVLDEIGFVTDSQTTWWEVTDALFTSGFKHEAILAQRHAVPMIGDLTSVARLPVISDLYGTIKAPTGELLVDAFNRMISAAVREYPVLSQATRFDIGDARIVSLDLDAVAKGGGAAAERQTSVMYMLSRYVLGSHFYLNAEDLVHFPEAYQAHHRVRIEEIREDQKRLVYDEFHRTASAQAVRDQVILDMREGRKWNVQIALISQSLEDFDRAMVEFGTSIFIMDAGPEQAVQKTTEVFGLSPTAKEALKQHVRGPRKGGTTFLAMFATKENINTQLLTLTLGPIELWAFSTTTYDSVLRNRLYDQIGPAEARRILANLFPGGSAVSYIEKKLQSVKEDTGMIDDQATLGILDMLTNSIIEEYKMNPDVKVLPA